MPATARPKILTPGLRLLTLTTLLATIALAGCSSGMPVGNGVTASQAVTGLHGFVYGGQQPVSGATITLLRINTDGTPATSILNNGATVTTGSDGTFSLTGKYSTTSCSATSQVYIVSTGGNPGDGGANSALALMAALGSCTALPSISNIAINEVSTVAAVYALQQFIGVSEGTAGAEDIAVNSTSGLSAQSTTGMINAFATVPNLVSLSTGVANTTVGNATMEAAKLNTIANIISSCVNTSGPTSTGCQSLFAAVTPSGSIYPGDTIQAALYIAQNPTNNVSTIFGLQPPTPPFPTDLSSAPFDWSLAITYSSTVLASPNLIASDAGGNMWVTNANSGNQSLTKIVPGGSMSSYLSGGSAFDGPQADVIDTNGNVWITAHSSNSTTGNRLVKFNTTSNTSTSYSLSSFGACDPYNAAIDGNNDIFFACNNLSTPSLYEMPASSPGSYVSIGPLNSATETYGMAIDSDTNVWAANSQGNDSMTEFTGATTGTASAVNNFSLGSAAYAVAIDSNNNAWAGNSDYLELYAINSKTSSNPSYTTSDYTGSGLTSAGAVAVDGSGSIWVSNRNTNQIAGVNYLTLSEFSSSGSPIGTSSTTVQPGGLSNAIIVNNTNVTDAVPRGLAIDPSGNVWIAGCNTSGSCSNGANSFVMEFVGVATPPVLPLASAISSNKLGCCNYIVNPPTGTLPAATPGYVGLQASTTAGNLSFTQNSGTFYFLVMRTGGFTGPLTVKYAYGSPSSGTAATYGTDYVDATSSASNITPYTTGNGYGTLTWTNGDTSSRTVGPIDWLDTTANGTTKSFVINLTCAACTGFSPYQSETVAVTAAPTAPSSVAAFNKYLNNTESMYLGLPVDEYGGTGGLNGAQFGWQTVSTSNLTNFSDSYFYATTTTVNSVANTPVVVFTAPSNGATSSPGSGSNDTRSEMREYYYGGTGNIDGDDWNTALGGTLTATVAVNSTSVDTSEATIGQIHGENEPYALLQYQLSCTYNTNNYTGCVVLAYSVTNTTNSPSSSVLLAYGVPTCSVSSLSSCTFFTYTLSIAPNSGSPLLNASVAKIYGSGTIYGSASVSVDSSWIGTASADGLYFKFGAYSGASNTGNPAGDQTQITFAFPTTSSGDCSGTAAVPYCISHP